MINSEVKELSIEEQIDIKGGGILEGLAAIGGLALAVSIAGIEAGRELYRMTH